MTYEMICKQLAAKRCRDSGMSVKEIARQARLSPTTIYRWLRNFVASGLIILAAAGSLLADSPNRIVRILADRVEGMNYQSEADSPLSAFWCTRPVESLSIKKFVAACDMANDDPVIEKDFDEFFFRQIERDFTGQWESLYFYMLDTFVDRIIIRNGRVNGTYFIAGRTAEGYIVGVYMQFVET